MLLCNCFQMYINLLVAVVCLFLQPVFPKGKSKKSRPRTDQCSPQLPFDIIHINLTFGIKLWSLASSMLKWFLWSETAVPFHSVALTSMTFEHKAQWIWINFTTITLSQSVFRQTHSVSPSNSFKCPLSLKVNTLYFGFFYLRDSSVSVWPACRVQ